MLGVLLALLVSLGAMGLGEWVCGRWSGSLDPAARWGVNGLAGLGILGGVLFVVGLFATSGILPAAIVIVLAAAGFMARTRKFPGRFEIPKGADLLFPLAIGLALLMCLFGVLAPSDTNDWDSLAYHLAAPKIWLEAGKIHVIPFIHQSNFPFTVDSLYLLGLKWGGQAGAKAFAWIFTLVGSIAIFGLARQRYGQRAGWWGALTFATMPVVLLETGTAYIDVAHGLYAGLGLIFACLWLESEENGYAWLSAIMLGFAVGSKYTGLQTLAVAGLVAMVGALLWKRNLKPVFVIGLVGLAIGAPWYVKNAVWKENPVFPFFYSKLGGKDWDQRRADIYTREQNTFGVGRSKPPEGSVEMPRAGHSVLGLAYQPGRYINPGQTQGRGEPLGAVGIAVIGALALGLLSGLTGRFEKALLASVLASLALWFVLTQQSRYIVALGVPLSLIAGQVANRRSLGVLMAGAVGLQAVYSLGLLHQRRFSDQMPVVLGQVTPDEYLTRRVGFYAPSKAINALGPTSKTALYDEVFGYFLDVPYFWANPGHSTIIPYDTISSGEQYADEMKKLGFTHVYMNLSLMVKEPVLASQILAAMSGQPFPLDVRQALFDNWEAKFNVLVPEAVAAGKLEIVQTFGNAERPRGVLLRIR